MAGLLAESFAVIERELPVLYQRLCARLSGRSVEIRVDEERFVAAFEAGRACVRTGEGEADALIIAPRRAILAVLDGRPLASAVLDGEVEAIAPLERLVEIQAGLVTYVHGAVRCPSFPALLARFRAECVAPTR